MKNLTPLLALVGTIVVPCLLAAPALAVPTLADTTYVDPVSGTDANAATTPPCNFTQPCATVGTALQHTGSPGNVVVVKAGTFSPITINSGQSITCTGVSCIFDASGDNVGILIMAGSTDTVELNGVSVSGFGSGGIGISVTQVGKLELKNVTISGNQLGLAYTPGGSDPSHLVVMDSEIRNSLTQNVMVAPNGGVAASAEFTRTRIHHANAGLLADVTHGTSGISVVISDSVISFANNNAVNANGVASGPAVVRILLNGVTVTHSSGNGVTANGATASVVLNNSEVSQTATALAPFNGGTIFSYGNNALNFNNSNGTAPTPTALN